MAPATGPELAVRVFEFHHGEDESERDEIIGSGLATVDFRELTQAQLNG